MNLTEQEVVELCRRYWNPAHNEAFKDMPAMLQEVYRLGQAARAEGDAKDAARYRAVKACDWIGLCVDGQEFIGISNINAWADARLGMNSKPPK